MELAELLNEPRDVRLKYVQRQRDVLESILAAIRTNRIVSLSVVQPTSELWGTVTPHTVHIVSIFHEGNEQWINVGGSPITTCFKVKDILTVALQRPVVEDPLALYPICWENRRSPAYIATDARIPRGYARKPSPHVITSRDRMQEAS